MTIPANAFNVPVVQRVIVLGWLIGTILPSAFVARPAHACEEATASEGGEGDPLAVLFGDDFHRFVQLVEATREPLARLSGQLAELRHYEDRRARCARRMNAVVGGADLPMGPAATTHEADLRLEVALMVKRRGVDERTAWRLILGERLQRNERAVKEGTDEFRSALEKALREANLRRAPLEAFLRLHYDAVRARLPTLLADPVFRPMLLDLARYVKGRGTLPAAPLADEDEGVVLEITELQLSVAIAARAQYQADPESFRRLSKLWARKIARLEDARVRRVIESPESMEHYLGLAWRLHRVPMLDHFVGDRAWPLRAHGEWAGVLEGFLERLSLDILTVNSTT